MGSAVEGNASRTILLIDDEDSVRAIVMKILQRAKYNVLEAPHGAEALRVAAAFEGEIDLVISDMYMPGLRGPEVIESLAPTRPNVRVLFMSGYTDEDVARWGVRPGTGFLHKPFTAQELTAAVEAVLAGPPGGPALS